MFPAQWYKIAGRTEPCLSLSTPMISPGKNASRANGAKGDARWARPKRPDASTILQKGETLAERIVWSHPRKNVSSATAAASPERTAAGTRRIEGKKSRPLKKSRRMEALINSMTPEERRNPDMLNGSRKRRITRGSGTEIQDLNRLLKQHKQMAKMMKKMKTKGGMANMMRGMGGMMPPGGGGNFPGM